MTNKTLRFICDVIIWLIPHFENEWVAVRKIDGKEDSYKVIAGLSNLAPGEVYDGEVLVSSFMWLNWGFFPSQRGDIYPVGNRRGK
jgi:hypothetical protein